MASRSTLILLCLLSASALGLGPMCGPVSVTGQAVPEGTLEFRSGHEGLNEGFAWAKARALAYAFRGDPVGPWYEAALPGREAFCMRDVSHQSTGAMALGLWPHTLNMFRKFAEGISPARDWASYWEINRLGDPAPVDYRNDADFWYNLPANFDVIQAVFRVYRWTGDPTYLNDPAFLEFYHRSLTDYVEAWDPDADGLMESSPANGFRGIPTYWEGEGPRPETGADLVAAQFAANRDYAAILRLRGEGGKARAFELTAERLRDHYNESWWNPVTDRFNTALLPGGVWDSSPLPLGQLYPLYFGIVRPGPRRDRMVEMLPDGGMVELNAYLPEVYFRNRRYERAFSALLAQLDPALPRRDYPEVSFTAIGHLVAELMGVRPLADQGLVETKSRLIDEVKWAHLNHLFIMKNQISLMHRLREETRLKNESGDPLRWRAVFAGDHEGLTVNGEPRPARRRVSEGEGRESFVEILVPPGAEVVVGVIQRR